MRTNAIEFGTRTNQHPAESTTSNDISLVELQNNMSAFPALSPTDVPDVYVMTTAAFQLIHNEVCKSSDVCNDCDLMLLFGIPIEHYATLREVYKRCLELRDSGKSVALVRQ